MATNENLGWCGPLDLNRIGGRHDRWARRPELECNLIVSGHGVYQIGTQSKKLVRGDMVWVFPGQDRAWSSCSKDFLFWHMLFRPQVILETCLQPENRVLLESDPGRILVASIPTPEVQSLVAQCRRWQGLEGQAGMRDFANTLLRYLLHVAWMAFNHGNSAAPSTMHPVVERAIALLHDQDDLTLPGLAEQVGMSAARLSRLFSSQVGCSIPSFRNRMRIDRFMTTYDRNRQSLTSAALDCGFGSYTQFNRMFRKATGCSPAEWCERQDRAAVST